MRVQERIARKERAKSGAGTGAGTTTGLSNAKRKEDNPSPSQQVEAGEPAPVTHAQEDMASRGAYEAAEPYRARRGDRFS